MKLADQPWSDTDLANLRALRDACHAVLQARIDGTVADPQMLALINGLLQHPAQALTLAQDGNDFVLMQTEETHTPVTFMAMIAARFAELIAETDPKRLKACAQPDCVLVFTDTSKSGRRRWCSMDTCGNRNQAATFRASTQG